jgi:hypothetical protein
MSTGRTRSRLVAVAGATLLALLVAEAAVRVVAPTPSPREGFPEVVWPSSEGAGPYYRLAPSVEFTHRWDGDPFGTLPEGAVLTYQLDALGYRSGAAAGVPTSLLVLGDSFTFGEGVEVADRFTDRLGPGSSTRAFPVGHRSTRSRPCRSCSQRVTRARC